MPRMTQDLKTAARETADHLRTGARQALESGRAEVADRIEEAKDDFAHQASDTADALRKAAGDSDREVPSRLLEALAQGVERAAGRLRDGSLAQDAGAFARRHPVTMIAGAFVAGFAATRFARASAKPAAAKPAAAAEQPPLLATGPASGLAAGLASRPPHSIRRPRA